jgi:hypothetical protein
MVFNNGKLIDRQPIVVIEGFKINQPNFITLDTAFGAILDYDAIGKHFVKGVIVADQRRRIGARDLSSRIFQCFGRYIGIDSFERVFQSPPENHLAIILAFGGWFARRDVIATKGMEYPRSLSHSSAVYSIVPEFLKLVS